LSLDIVWAGELSYCRHACMQRSVTVSIWQFSTYAPSSMNMGDRTTSTTL